MQIISQWDQKLCSLSSFWDKTKSVTKVKTEAMPLFFDLICFIITKC